MLPILQAEEKLYWYDNSKWNRSASISYAQAPRSSWASVHSSGSPSL
jgi:hypothetical protein